MIGLDLMYLLASNRLSDFHVVHFLRYIHFDNGVDWYRAWNNCSRPFKRTMSTSRHRSSWSNTSWRVRTIKSFWPRRTCPVLITIFSWRCCLTLSGKNIINLLDYEYRVYVYFFSSEIATSLERAFRTLATKEAAHLLLYTSVDEVTEFANKVGRIR